MHSFLQCDALLVLNPKLKLMLLVMNDFLLLWSERSIHRMVLHG